MGKAFRVGWFVILAATLGCGGGGGGGDDGDAGGPRSAARNVMVSVVSADAVLVSWTDTASDETGFTVERGATAEGPFEEVGRVGPDVTSYADPGVSGGQTYYYRVLSLGPAGPATLAPAEAVETPAALDPPSIPNNLKAKALDQTSVRLTWRDTSANETGFVIEKWNDAGSFVEIGTTGPDVSQYIVSGLEPYTYYLFQVRASNADGVSRPSGAVSATTLGVPDSVREVVSSIQDGPDGPETSVRTVLRFGADGRLSRLERDEGDDGTVDRVAAYTYAAEGDGLREDVDAGADGTVDTQTLYNAAGDAVSRGRPGRILFLSTYDELGYLRREERDLDEDPEDAPDSVTTYTPGERGEPLKEEYDADGNGVCEMTVTRSFDAWLNPLTEMTVRDTDDDGIGEFTVLTLFNAKGDTLRVEANFDGDGVLDEIATTAYFPDGTVEDRTEFNDDDQGGPDRVYVGVGHPEGSAALFESRDLNGDGNPEEKVTRTFHGNGMVSSEFIETDADSDGVVDSSIRYLYDEDGTGIGVVVDSNGDGIPD